MKGKRFLSFMLVLILLAAILGGCKAEKVPVDEPDNGEDIADVVELDAGEVLLEAAEKLMKNLPADIISNPKDTLEDFEENPQAMFWIDMRGKDDYDKGHIDGAVNIPYAKIGENLDRIPMNKKVVLQCYSGQTSAQAVAVLQMAGFNAISYQGGMNFGWSTLELSEDTLVTTAVDLPDAKAPELDEAGQIVWDAAVKYFSSGGNFIISPDDLNDLVEENPDAIMVLDIRGDEAYEKGHIEGAVSIAYKEVGNNFDKLPTNKPIYVVCFSGQTAGVTIGALRMAGFNAMSLNRGMAGWGDLPVVQ